MGSVPLPMVGGRTAPPLHGRLCEAHGGLGQGRSRRRTLTGGQEPYEGWPPNDPDGLRLLNGWQFKQKLLLRMSKPPGSQSLLSLRLGPSRAIEHQYGRQPPERLWAVRKWLLDAPARAAAAAERLMSREDFDLVWITFSAAPFSGHYYWDLSETLRIGTWMLRSAANWRRRWPTPTRPGRGHCVIRPGGGRASFRGRRDRAVPDRHEP